MGTFNWDEIESWLDTLMDCEPRIRESKLNELKSTNYELYEEVSGLMAAMDESSDFLENDACSAARSLLDDLGRSRTHNENRREEELKDKRVGAWRLREKLGAGGMGMVWLAERTDGSFTREVALKFIRSGMENEEVMRRFRNEQQILASLNHPNIAQLYDAGQDEFGMPYIVMEYVDGLPLPEYCSKHKLTLEARLRLFSRICEAVHFAHQNLVIHRDLKPSNILVADDGTVKLLDFGIAKMIGPEASSGPDLTVSRMPFMSAAYASPEQLKGEAVSTSTDIYTLGVILYEILSGVLPYSPDSMQPAALFSTICEGNTEKPSRRLRSLRAAGEKAPPTDLNRLIKNLQGDLDNIILKAMAVEPSRRYGSAEALQNDIGRYLKGEPVLARPLTPGYRMSRFITRNKIPVALMMMLLLVTGIALFYHTQQLETERDLARQQAERAEQVAGFMSGIFEAANPTVNPGEELTARDLLEKGDESAENLAIGNPELYASFMLEMGRAWEALGDFGKALEAYEKSLQTRRDLLPSGHPDIAASLFHKADMNMRYIPGDENPEELFREVLETRKAALGENHVSVAQTYIALGTLYGQSRGDSHGSRAYYEKAVEIMQRTLDHDDPDLLDTRSSLGFVTAISGDTEQGIAIVRDVARLQEEVLPEHHENLVFTYNNLGMLYRDTGDYEQAYKYQQRSLEGYRYIYGNDHLYTGIVMMNTTRTLANLERYQEAIDMSAELIRIMEMNLRPNHGYFHPAYIYIGDYHLELGNLDEAEAYYRKGHKVMDPDTHRTLPSFVHGLNAFGRLHIARQEYEEAEEVLNETLELYELHENVSESDRLSTRFTLARALWYQGRTEEAEALFRQIAPVVAAQYPEGHSMREQFLNYSEF